MKLDGVNQTRPKYILFKLPYNLCGFILQVIWAEEAQLTKNCKVNLDVTGIYCHSLGKIDTMGSIILWKIFNKVEKILKGSLDLISSPSVKIQIMGGKVCLRCKGKTLLGVVNKLLLTKSLFTSPSKLSRLSKSISTMSMKCKIGH